MKKNKILLWFVPNGACLKPISLQEIRWKNKLSSIRSLQFEHSRGYVREALSHTFKKPPLEIPLKSPPGLPPELPEEMGFVSFSHCKDVLIISWSLQKIGVDIERSDRFFKAKKILNGYFSNKEKQLFKDLKDYELNSEVLKLWVRKEAAIKWQQGSIFSDLSKWNLNLFTNKLENKEDGYIVESIFLNYEDWYISIACNNNSEEGKLIFCKY